MKEVFKALTFIVFIAWATTAVGETAPPTSTPWPHGTAGPDRIGPERKAYEDEVRRRMIGAKRDLKGFYPGITETEFKEKYNSTCATGNEDKCFLKNGTIEFKFTTKLNPPLLKELHLVFLSGATPQQMIATTTEQFNAAPIKADWSREIASAIEGRYDCMPNLFSSGCHTVRVVGGTVARWRFDNGLDLVLDLNRPSVGSQPNEYILVLADRQIDKMEALANRRETDELQAKARAVNPNPKF